MDDLASFHNLSFALNITSILDYLPNRFLARFLFKTKPAASRTELDITTLPPSTISDFIGTNGWDSSLDVAAKSPTSHPKAKITIPPSEERSLLLGPLGFFTSGYMLGLFLMAFILHRLHHTMIPSRLSRRGHRHTRLSPGRAIIFVRIYRAIFPIDMSRTLTRLILQSPTLYCLLRMLLLWGLIILQTSGFDFESLPTWAPEGIADMLQRLSKWAAHKPMEEVCWISFCSLSAAYLVESFIRKLDELANGTIEDMHLGRQMSPYNLVAHSFVLYLFSLSASHAHKLDGLPARPDTHALITMGIPLLQSTIFHFLCVSKKYSNHRLIPTALTSFLGLVHFHTTIFLHGYPAVFLPLISDRNKDNVFTKTGFRSSYPLMNYFSCLIETTLISIIILTVFLNALIQLLVNGRVDRVFTTLGLAAAGGLSEGSDSGPLQFSWASFPFEEEWGVVLMRIGTASLEATGLKGWGNEVAPLSTPLRPAPSRRRGRRSLPPPPGMQVTFGTVRMGRSGVGNVVSGRSVSDENHSGISRTGSQAPRLVALKGFNNEVRSVETNISAGSRRAAERERWVWVRELARFVRAISGAAWGLMRLSWWWAWRRGNWNKGCEGELVRQSHVSGTVPASVLRTRVESNRGEERELYQRFLRGEDISDDEDVVVDSAEGDDVDDDDDDETGSSSEVGDGGTEVDPSMDATNLEHTTAQEQQEREDEAITLFTDLIRAQGVDEGSKMVLSHLVHGSKTTGRETLRPPLTRRRWGELIERDKGWGLEIVNDTDLTEQEDGWELDFEDRGLDADGAGEANWTDQTMCIICTSRLRDIVSWPCRCLTMCDQCREVLAARGSPGRHHCPCCRQPIEGYSRIFTP